MNPLQARLKQLGLLSGTVQENQPAQTQQELALPAAPVPQTSSSTGANNALSILDRPVGAAPERAYASSDIALEAAVESCKNLGHALRENLPNVEIYVQEINTQLREYPELVQLLQDDEIHAVYAALRNRTGVAITVAKSKSKKSAGLLSNGQSVADLL